MTVRFMGGLGNQMFQYAFGRSVSLAQSSPLFFDRSTIDADLKRSYSMGAYDVDIRFSGQDGPMYRERGIPFDDGVFSAPTDSVFCGYWQTEKYFNIDVIRKELLRPRGAPNDETRRVAQNISTTKNNAFVHVRRGDYVGASGGCGSQPLEYYLSGMEYLKKRFPEIKFFIFSDEPEWCRQNLTGNNIEVVMANKPGDGHTSGTEHWDIWLMSLCSHAVIANSSFSWWGAWLHPEKERIVIAPRNWFLGKLDSRDIVPERWVKL